MSVCVCACTTSTSLFASLTSMSGRISKETNTVHKSHGWQLQELNPSRQRKPSGGENLTLYSPVLPHSLSLYLAVVNLLKICGHKFNATQVDGPTTNTQIHTYTHTIYTQAGGQQKSRTEQFSRGIMR